MVVLDYMDFSLSIIIMPKHTSMNRWMQRSALWFQMAVMISSGFLVAWTPYVAVSFWSMRNSQRQGHMAPSVMLLPCLFAKSSTAYNPFIYFFFQRNTGHKLLPFHRPAFSSSDQADSSRVGEKEESRVSRSLGFACFGAGTYETCTGVAGAQSQREIAELGWCHLLVMFIHFVTNQFI